MRRSLALVFLLANTAACPAPGTPSGPSTEADASVDARTDAASAMDDLSSALAPSLEQGLPAIAAAVFDGEGMRAVGAIGSRKLGDPSPVTSEDKWHLGSDTKAMTATLVALYVDQGKLSFDDTIGALFAGETIDPGYSAVTLEALLRHRGGAPGNIPTEIWSAMWKAGKAPDARKNAVLAMLGKPPAQTPGKFAYSNAGYMVVGAALERKFGGTWETMLASMLFSPLGMQSCGFGAPASPDRVDQPWGHSVSGGKISPVPPGPQADNPPSLGPAGTVHCNLRDWGAFLRLHLKGARGEATMVSRASMARLHTPPPGGDYAAGWGVTSRGWTGGSALQHTGSNTMFVANAWIAPAKNLVFVVVSNRGDDLAITQADAALGPLIETYAR